MSYPHILQHGAFAGVTGSCHQLRMDTQQSLFGGCGLFQAADASQVGAVGLDNLAIYAPLSDTKTLLFPHVHIDRLGRNSYLHAADFNWPILCSESSTKLLLDDALKCGFSCDKQQTVRYLERLEPQITALPYDRWFSLVDAEQLKAAICRQRAVHIPGSTYVKIEQTYKQSGLSRRTVFYGDLGVPHSSFLPASNAPGADILMIENTYCDRLHEDSRSRRQPWLHMIGQALAKEGDLVIAALFELMKAVVNPGAVMWQNCTDTLRPT